MTGAPNTPGGNTSQPAQGLGQAQTGHLNAGYNTARYQNQTVNQILSVNNPNATAHFPGSPQAFTQGHPQSHLQGQTPVRKPVPKEPMWWAVLRSIDITRALSGIRISQNFLFLLMFLAFIGWLFVVYWIRHMEQPENKFAARSFELTRRMAADRDLVAGMQVAVPVRTTSSTGQVWTPGNTVERDALATQGNPYPVLSQAGAVGATQVAAGATNLRFGQPYSGYYQNANQSSNYPTPDISPAPVAPAAPSSGYAPQYGQSYLPPPNYSDQASPSMGYGSYTLGKSDDGGRLKMFVNR